VFLWYGDQREVIESLVRERCAHALGETKSKRKAKRLKQRSHA
jgi:hypothetical protein